jgi:pyruvate formate lyase activating enzyme
MQKEALLYEVRKSDGKVHCYLCSHHCVIADGKWGFCRVRQNVGGKLYTHVYGNAIAAGVDPIEKKPLYHFLPGTLSFSIATQGCNFHCGFCQNWQISQIAGEGYSARPGYDLPPEKVVQQALEKDCQSISYTYTEPTIFFEYAYDTAVLAREEGLSNVFVTNGFMTREALETAQPVLDACNVDLKSFRKSFYKESCEARLQPVLESIRIMHSMGIWLEITTLIVPGSNDSPEELRDIAEFIAEVDPRIPWHISRFHPDYQYTDKEATPLETLEQAYDLGKEAGVRYIYMGNVPGSSADTHCPRCGNLLVRRIAGRAGEIHITGGKCPGCSEPVAGVFG